MLRIYLYIGILLTGMGLPGCVSMPEETLSPVIQEAELSDHVRFLAQPALKGRKPFTWESRLARKYIGERFEAYDLVPWGKATSYAQSFVIGTNVIGVLPGSDPNLAQEFVILSAHYDHLGKTEQGLCVGACDNASGVAALLEIAEQLVLSKSRPKRSICFAAFDQEETALLGAFAFTRRSDFDETEIAGVVNIDSLGRNGFEVLENHLFVTGTEGYASLRNQLLQAGSDLQVLPVGTDIVGARGDHVAFETMNIPTLFFTCGPFEDYHKDSDTADKLDYGKIRKSTHIAFTALKILADTPERLEKRIIAEDYLQEISALQLCLDRIVKGPEALGWTQEQVAPIARFSAQLEELKQESQFDSQARRRLLLNNFNHLVPLLTWPQDDPDPNDSDAVQQRHEANWRMALANLDFRPEVIATGRALIDHVNKHKSRLLWGVPDFKHMQFGLRDDYVSLIKGAKEESCLVFMPFYSALTVRPPGLLKWKQASYTWSFGWLPGGMIGTHDELVDACLLRWPEGRPPGVWDSSWQDRLSLVTGLQNEWTYDQWLQWRLDQGPWSQKDEWLLANMTSHNPYVANFAIRQTWETMKCRSQPRLCELITNKAFRGSIRKTAIEVLDKEVDRSLLLALAQIVDDTSADLKFGFSINDQHPLSELLDFIQTNQEKGRALAAKRKKPKGEQKPKVKPKTLGGHALKKLTELTGQDFGTDKQAWSAWIEADYHNECQGKQAILDCPGTP